MTTDTTASPAPAGDMNEADATAAFEALAAAKFDTAEDPAPAETPEPEDETEAAPAAPEVPATVPAAAAPAAAATDIWSSATPELRAAHEADLARWDQKYKSDIGRVAAYQRQVEDLRAKLAETATPAAATATPAATTTSLREQPAIKKSLEDYPEVVGPILDALEPVVAENVRLGREVSTLSEDRRSNVIASQEQALTTAHPDWRQACASRDFADWLNAQPASVRQIVERNGEQVVDAAEAIAMVGNFKAHFALTHPPAPPVVAQTQPAPTNLAARREAQLSAVTAAPKGGVTAIPDGAAAGDESAVFNHFVAKKAQKG